MITRMVSVRLTEEEWELLEWCWRKQGCRSRSHYLVHLLHAGATMLGIGRRDRRPIGEDRSKMRKRKRG